MGASERIIVVDDETDLRNLVADYLGKHGYAVRRASGGQELDLHLAEATADLVLLDVNMPGEDGFAVARRLRASSNIPIIMLTAADDVVDKIVGLEIGADDYVAKPFDLRELRARIGTVLRRSRGGTEARPADGGAPAHRGAIQLGRVAFDPDTRSLIAPDGAVEHLTASEHSLLSAFASNANRVLSRDRLLELLGEQSTEASGRAIDVRITRIRRKIENDPSKPQVIRTVRGAGYIFVPDRTRT